MRNAFLKLALACVVALGALAAAGCASNAANPTAVQGGQAFMSRVNSVMGELGDELESFTDAVSRGDVVNMRTQADNAYKALDKLNGLEAPDGYGDVKQQYIDGAAKMREALDAYIALFTAVKSGSFDQATYPSRLADVQSLYDEGIEKLKKADEAAAAL